MTKAEIISMTLADCLVGPATPLGNDTKYKDEVVAALEASLLGVDPGMDIRTCGDFIHLNVECCKTCHELESHYEMSLRGIESGGNAWICCAMDRALNPVAHAIFKESEEYLMFERILGGQEEKQ